MKGEGMGDAARPGATRVLVAFEGAHGSYRGAIAEVLRAMFPDAEVSTAGAGRLDEVLAAFRPDVVISDMPESPGSSAFAWAELAIEPTEGSRLRAGGEEWRAVNPGIEELARLVELAAGGDPRR